MPELNINGPAGRLEARYHHAPDPRSPIALILHPHPQFGGTMNNPVVHQLYYMFHERGFSQAVLMDGRWKAIRMRRVDAPVEIYDVVEDIGELRNLAESRPDLLSRAVALFRSERTDAPGWVIPKPVSP